MSIEILTLNDLQEFKTELLEEIRSLIGTPKTPIQKKWLKSTEVRRMLNISPGTLQTLRVNGTLPYSKIGGTIYYNTADIEKVLSKKP